MTKKDLEKMRALIKELKELRSKMEASASPREMVADTVKDYRYGYPVHITIRGYGQNDWPRMQQKYYDKLRQILATVIKMEDWLDTIDDPEMRVILRMRYVDCKSQEQIAEYLECSRRTVKRKLAGFWQTELSKPD